MTFIVTVAAAIAALVLLVGGFAAQQPFTTGSSTNNGEAQKLENPCLALTLNLEPEVKAGEVLTFQLKLKNVCDHPVGVDLGGRPPHDVVVTGPDDNEVWRWRHEQVIQTILEHLTLDAGETSEFTAEWDQRDNNGNPLPPGRYLVTGILNEEPPQVLKTEPVPLTIIP